MNQKRIDERIASAGIASTRDHRGQMDTVGYPPDAKHMEQILNMSQAYAVPRVQALARHHAWTSPVSYSAVLCPHDDYVYAHRHYILSLSRLTAPRIVLFGVHHAARLFECSNHFVFDDFAGWRGPWGPVRVSNLRDSILSNLPESFYTVSREAHIAEHSLEAMIPWLQAMHGSVEIVPILVPEFHWSELVSASDALGHILADICRSEQWIPGRDIAFIFSNDAVHYGDVGWGSGGYAPFGCDASGYIQMTGQDQTVLREHLTGPVTVEKTRAFYEYCTDPEHPDRYRATWCGRFSVSAGLLTLAAMKTSMDTGPAHGFVLDYGTSISEVTLETEGIGRTAPNHFHHWVGYASAAYI